MVKSPLVSILIVTFNSQDYILNCLQSVFKTSYKPIEIIIIDNNSSNSTIDLVSRKYPKLTLVQSGQNLGYAGGNNLGAKQAKGKYLAILNPDTMVQAGWLTPLVDYMESNEVAVCQPKICLMQNNKLINTTGKTTQYLGFEYLSGYMKNDININQAEITSFSGSAFLVSKELFLNLGGFAEYFFMYYEDGDFSWRLRLLGYKIMLIPDSVVYHQYKYLPKETYQKSSNKFYLLERNRLIMVLQNYSLKSLVLLFPAILFLEIGMFLYFIFKGWGLMKIKEFYWIVQHRHEIIRTRNKIQKTRIISDSIIVSKFTDKIDFKELNNFILSYFVNPLLSVYWQIIKQVL